mgnify:CR=1 FL=1
MKIFFLEAIVTLFNTSMDWALSRSSCWNSRWHKNLDDCWKWSNTNNSHSSWVPLVRISRQRYMNQCDTPKVWMWYNPSHYYNLESWRGTLLLNSFNQLLGEVFSVRIMSPISIRQIMNSAVLDMPHIHTCVYTIVTWHGTLDCDVT